MAATPKHILIVGLGSIGRRHLSLLPEVAPEATVTVVRRPGGELDAGVADGVRLSHDLEAAAAAVDAAIVANPAPFHVETALALARQDVHLLVEKPLSVDAGDIDTLIGICRDRELVLQVGYSLRFDAGLQVLKQALDEGHIGNILSIQAEVGQYLPDWRPGSDFRTGLSARADLGGGVLLELSHEIDLLRWLVGEIAAVSALTGTVGGFGIDVEDQADLMVSFANGAKGLLHLDMVQRHPVRSCRITGSDGSLAWDGMAGTVKVSRQGADWDVLHAAQEADRNDMYRQQLLHFLDCIAGKDSPRVSGEDGLKAVETVVAARRSAAEERTVHL